MEPSPNPSPSKPTAIRSILLCGDLLATRISEQASNVRWLTDLLERPITTACQSVPFRVGLADFDVESVIAGAAEKNSLNARHRWFDAERIDAASLIRLREAVGADTLLIGYELSHATRRALDRAGLSWIDIWLHPVRFSDDILFALRSSLPDIQRRIDSFAVADETFLAQADLLKIQGYRGFTKLNVSLAEGAALFVGQTARDKSVLSRTGFLGIADFADGFSALTRAHSQVYFSRHPNEPRLLPEVTSLIARFDNVLEIDEPTYALLASPQIKTVASVSSSVLEEARYFRKNIVRFHPPPFPLDGDQKYAAILQHLCFSHFWSTILGDVVEVARTTPAHFIAPRNKLRHALSFQWGYRDIDYYERLNKVPGQDIPSPSKKATLATAEIVSFDVFDTLVTRRVAAPRDVFEMMSHDAADITGLAPDVFANRRIDAERQATRSAERSGREDPALREIYAALLDCDIGDPRIDALSALEVSTEVDIAIPRPAGRALFEAARAAGKRIVLLSDMYLPKTAVGSILSQCGYTGWEELYLSSERGLTKRTGTLFQALISERDVPPTEILHVGDNRKGDKEVPEKLGISCLALPKATEALDAAAPYFRKAATQVRSEGVEAGSAILAQIANRYFDDPATALSDDLGRDAEAFGYIALGPFVTGLAGWIAKQAEKDGIKHLAFLTREGPLFRDAFELLYPDAPFTTETVFASRRMVRAASFQEPEDIAGVPLSKSRQYRTQADFLRVEFGLPADTSGLANARMEDASEARLRELVSSYSDRILEHSANARENLRSYLQSTGLKQNAAAVVDIGYAGRVQAAFADILGTEIGGYYALTFRSASDTLRELPHAAYLGANCRPMDRWFGLVRHRKLYETFLCSPGPSFVGIERTPDGWQGLRDTASETPLRDEFVTAAHRGALNFVRDFASVKTPTHTPSPRAATAFLDAMLQSPTNGLARWLAELEFDDPFDGRGVVPIVDVHGKTQASIWSEAADAVAARMSAAPARRTQPKQWNGPYGILGWRHLLTPIVAVFVARLGDVQDADHYRDDPIGFFRRLSDPRYQRIGRILYPRD